MDLGQATNNICNKNISHNGYNLLAMCGVLRSVLSVLYVLFHFTQGSPPESQLELQGKWDSLCKDSGGLRRTAPHWSMALCGFNYIRLAFQHFITGS